MVVVDGGWCCIGLGEDAGFGVGAGAAAADGSLVVLLLVVTCGWITCDFHHNYHK